MRTLALEELGVERKLFPASTFEHEGAIEARDVGPSLHENVYMYAKHRSVL